MDDGQKAGEFRAQVERLVAAGKLTAEEGAELLAGMDDSLSGAGGGEREGEQATDVPPDLFLEVRGFSLQVVEDSSVNVPQLHVSEEGRALLRPTPQGWQVVEAPGSGGRSWQNVRAILTLPFAPRHVQAELRGGNIVLPALGGELKAEVRGGNLRAQEVQALRAGVRGGNITVGEVAGQTDLSVQGGNLSVQGAAGLNASVQGGNLDWAGTLSAGDHRAEVHGGNIRLRLLPGSSVRLEADLTAGNFSADFPTHKSGASVRTHHQGQLGAGDARLSCQVMAGQLRVVTQ